MDFIPITEGDISEMLAFLGMESIDKLFDLSIPEGVRMRRPLDIPEGLSEPELLNALKEMASDNVSLDGQVSFRGAGAYDHFIPSIVDAVVSLPEFYTPYTPYQPEVSQGILQALFEYQSMVCELTGLDVSNASLYDGSTAVAEAALFAYDLTQKRQVIISEAVHPEYRAVLESYTRGIGVDITTIPMKNGVTDADALEESLTGEAACVIVQQPNFFGYLEDTVRIGKAVAGHPALFIVSADPISLGILEAPANYGADVVVGEGQPLGNHINFGGPYLGLFACRQEHVRRVPGRLTGATTDTEGRESYVFTLQAREQHIRRERATSNICTSEVLNAISAAVYLSAVGPQGLREVASQCLQKAHYAHDRLREIDYLEPLSDAPFFREFAFRCDRPTGEVNGFLRARGIIGGLNAGRLDPGFEDILVFCVTEKRTKREIDLLVETMGAL